LAPFYFDFFKIYFLRKKIKDVKFSIFIITNYNKDNEHSLRIFIKNKSEKIKKKLIFIN
tara:strand:- start:139 stop:315 length:177 start_codon:yes stop_codon:yes gene_type:complete